MLMTDVREEKKAFIRAKYEKRRYAIVTCADVEDRRQDLKQAILSRAVSYTHLTLPTNREV